MPLRGMCGLPQMGRLRWKCGYHPRLNQQRSRQSVGSVRQMTLAKNRWSQKCHPPVSNDGGVERDAPGCGCAVCEEASEPLRLNLTSYQQEKRAESVMRVSCLHPYL